MYGLTANLFFDSLMSLERFEENDYFEVLSEDGYWYPKLQVFFVQQSFLHPSKIESYFTF